MAINSRQQGAPMTVEQRLTRLERSATRWRLLATLFGACLLAVVMSGAIPEPPEHADQLTVEKLTAQRVFIKHPDGRSSIMIEAQPDSASIQMIAAANLPDDKTSVGGICQLKVSGDTAAARLTIPTDKLPLD